MLSLTSNYALRALIYLAQHVDEWPISGKAIAAEAGIPAKYLSRIMRDLVRAGLLRSTRGPNGGFRLPRSAKDVSLYDVLLQFESSLADLRPCPFGNKICSDDDPCLGHDEWKKVCDNFRQYLRRTSIHDVACKGRGR